MKKFTAIICLLTALMLALTGCSNTDAPEGFQHAENEHEVFNFFVPNTWIVNNSGGTASAYYSTSDYSNMSFTRLIIDPGSMDDLAEYKAVTVAELGALLKDFVLIESSGSEDTSAETGSDGEKTELKIDGRETIVFEYKCTLSGKTYCYKQAVTMKDDFFYIFTYTALEENYEKHLKDVDATISNIRFK